MAFPKLLQKLFQNNGAGDKLNQDIIPDIPYSKITDAPVVDSALSPTSTNAVQNKVINSALDGKLSLTGGTMTSDISFNNSLVGILKADKNGSLVLSGGNTISSGGAGSAILFLAGGNDSSGFNAPGEFSLQASKGTYGQSGFSSHELRGKPDGSLTWDGHNVITVVSESLSANSWYRKYSDGWIEQWILTPQVSFTFGNMTLTWVTFPVAFTSTFYWTIAGERQTSYRSYDSQESGDSNVDTYEGLVTLTVNKTGITGKSSWPSGSDHYNPVTLPANKGLYVCGK